VHIPSKTSLSHGYNESIFWDNDDNLDKSSMVVLRNVAFIDGKIHLYQLDQATKASLTASVRQYKHHVQKQVGA
jgi:hypothetical protein